MKKINHIAIIMDGNRRWAKKNNLDLREGHKKGSEVAWQIIEYAAKNSVNNLSLFAFSSENWMRSPAEVKNIIDILDNYLYNEYKKISDLNIRFKFVGDITKLSINSQKRVIDIQNETKNNKGMNLYVAFSYSGRCEIVNAVKKAIKKGLKESDITKENFNQLLYDKEMPDVDFLIRTSGEMRISNFLLWQSAYAELYFDKKFWPEYTIEDFDYAIQEFYKRKRNFGVK